MKRFRMTVGDTSYQIEIQDPAQSPMIVTVDGETFTVAVQALGEQDTAPAAEAPPPDSGESPPAGKPQVAAPMPGTILDIAVQVGDRVEYGQSLCALEAMKMKSPIRASHAGVVRQIQVHEGQTVEHGDLLFVVE